MSILYGADADLAQSREEAALVLDYNGVPLDMYPSEIGKIPGSTSYYYWQDANTYPGGRAGNIYIGEWVLDPANKVGPETKLQIITHETIHLAQDKLGLRDMTDRAETEMEAQAWAIEWRRYRRGEIPNPPPPLRNKAVPTPVRDFWTIRNNSIPVSTCIIPGMPGIEASPGCACSTFDLRDMHQRPIYGLMQVWAGLNGPLLRMLAALR